MKIAGKKVLLLHEPDNLAAIADSGHFDVIVYGHTHEIDVREEGVLIINPRECGGWVTGKYTVAVWNTETNEVAIEEM